MTLPNKSYLLSIPREIRNSIYEYLILLYPPKSIPSSPGDPGPRYKHKYGYQDRTWHLSSERFPEHLHLNILLCNHQLNAEFSYILKKITPTVNDAKLDCMMEADWSVGRWTNVWPTWTTFPGRHTSHIKTLQIDFCIWDAMQMGGIRRRSIVVVFFELLSLLLTHGPKLAAATGDDESTSFHGISVDLVCINILPQPLQASDRREYYDEKMLLDDIGCRFDERFRRLQGRERRPRFMLNSGKWSGEYPVWKEVLSTIVDLKLP